ncbi:MAG TPA: hypothetical protein PKW90_08740, partial [Myxococcota bacterium]|nr:hypothetical protein [Myxococcota bacterium]
MQLDALNRVLAGGRWFSFNAGLEAVRAIPEVMDGLPHMTGEPPVIVVTCREVIKPLLRSPGIEADPLVGALYRLVEQGLVLSRGAAVVPLLETWRQMRLKVLALPPQGRAMEAAFQSSRLGAVVAVTPDIPALAKVICLEQAALMHTDQELEEDGETSARRRSLAIARLAASLRAPEDRSVEQLRWPRMDELKVGVLAVGLGALRSEGFRTEVDQRWQKLREALPEALWVDQGVVGLALSLKVPQFLQLDVAGILGAGVSAGFGYGVVQGGTDGLMTRVVGAPVEGALRAMVRGRKDEISLEEETLNALGPLLLGLGGRSVPGESRAWDLAGRRYTADLATSGVYTLRSRKVTVEAPVAEPFGEEFENMLAEAFGAAPSPVPSPPPSPAPSPAAGRIDPKRTAVFFGPGGPTSPTAPTAPAAPPAPNRSFPPQSTEVTQTGARLRTVVPEATVVEKKPPPPPVVPPEESWRNVPKAPSAEASAGVRRVPPAPAPAPVEPRPSRKPSLADTSLQDEDTRSTRKLPTPAEERSKSSRKPPPPAVVAEESPRPPPKVPPPAIVPEAPARRGKSFVHPPAFVEPIRRG